MKKIAFITLAVLLTTQSAFAILSPLNQSIREIKALLSDPQIKKIGNSSAIQEVQKSETGYTIFNNDSFMRVDVIYQARKGPAPLKFDFVFHEASPIITTAN